MSGYRGPEFYSTDPIVGGCNASNRLPGVVFARHVNQVVIVNDANVNLHHRLDSTVASTDDWYLKAGESQTYTVQCEVVGLTTTTTSTTQRARVLGLRY